MKRDQRFKLRGGAWLSMVPRSMIMGNSDEAFMWLLYSDTGFRCIM